MSARLLALAALVALGLARPAAAQDASHGAGAPSEPAHDEPAHDEPAHDAPAHDEPLRLEVASTEATVLEPAPDEASDASPSRHVPDALGLPLEVHVGVSIVELLGVDENEDAFDATLDARVTWIDRSLSYPAQSHPTGWLAFEGEEADAQLARMWQPGLRLANMDGEPAYTTRGLRIGPEGQVELLERVTARFHASFDVERFPFDRQGLGVEIVADRAPHELVTLVFRQADLDYTRLAPELEADGWHARSIDLSHHLVRGWHGQSHDAVHATVSVEREAAETAAPIFIPLFASLIIPLLAIWLNKLEEGEFKIEAFELANVIVGGLFAVIALNFTVSSELATLAHGDNTVARLFSLNYLTLATALLVNLAVFRYRVLRSRFGPFVEEELFRVMTWAIPTFAFGTAIAFVLVAYA